MIRLFFLSLSLFVALSGLTRNPAQRSLLVFPASTLTQPLPLYKNASASIEKRMTVEEHVGQLPTLLGWEMYDKQGDAVQISRKFEQAIQEHMSPASSSVSAHFVYPLIYAPV